MSYYLIANCKMYLSPKETVALITAYNHLAYSYRSYTLCICPSMENIAPATLMTKESGVAVGAQNCSTYTYGPHTGQISAQALAALECSYCIVGHSETRKEFHESNEAIAHKVAQLLQVGITPILCVGESEQMPTRETQAYIATQLKPVIDTLSDSLLRIPRKRPLLITYEPAWAIGSNKPASVDHVLDVLSWIRSYCSPTIPHIHTLYGGSVSAETIEPFLGYKHLQGFLLGRAGANSEHIQRILETISG